MIDHLEAASALADEAGDSTAGYMIETVLDAVRADTWPGNLDLPPHQSEGWGATMARSKTISVNRAPVLTLWVAVVAQRLGFDEDEALTLGRAVAGLNAYSKGVSLGLFQPSSKEVKEQRAKLMHGEQLTVDLFHRAVPVVHTKDGLRARSKDRPITPDSVRRYLQGKFGDALDAVTAAMTELARSRSPGEIAKVGYALYEKFRPVVPAGVRGWGATGKLDLGVVRGLSKTPKSQA